MLGDTALAVHPDDERYKDLIGRDGDPADREPAASRSSPTRSSSIPSSAPAS